MVAVMRFPTGKHHKLHSEDTSPTVVCPCFEPVKSSNDCFWQCIDGGVAMLTSRADGVIDDATAMQDKQEELALPGLSRRFGHFLRAFFLMLAASAVN